MYISLDPILAQLTTKVRFSSKRRSCEGPWIVYSRKASGGIGRKRKSIFVSDLLLTHLEPPEEIGRSHLNSLQRWELSMLLLDFEIKHVSRMNFGHADVNYVIEAVHIESDRADSGRHSGKSTSNVQHDSS